MDLLDPTQVDGYAKREHLQYHSEPKIFESSVKLLDENTRFYWLGFIAGIMGAFWITTMSQPYRPVNVAAKRTKAHSMVRQPAQIRDRASFELSIGHQPNTDRLGTNRPVERTWRLYVE
jgi:hypothetical protein